MNNNSLVHECFGNHDSLKKYLYILKYEQNNDTLDGIDMKYLMPPILCRQLASIFTTDGYGNIVESSYEINQKLLHNSKVKHCLDEYELKYKKYSENKILLNKFNQFAKKHDNLLPYEILLEIKSYVV